MRKILVIIILSCKVSFGQSLTILPNSGTNSDVLKISKIGIGLDHRTTNNIVGVGTYANALYGILQTHTNHPLGFATGNSFIKLMLQTNGNFGIGMTDPQYLLDVKERARIRTGTNTAGIWFSKSTYGIDEGSFFGNINDASAGIWIGNTWRFGINDAGTVWIPSLAGTGTRQVGADANGNLVIQSNQTIAFSAGITSQKNIPGNSGEVEMGLNYELFDVSNNYISSSLFSSYFYVPTDGVYHFTLNVYWSGNANGYRRIALRNEDNILLKMSESYPSHSNIFHQSDSCDLYLTAGTEVYLNLSQSSGTSLTVGNFIDGIMLSAFKVK